MQVSDILAVKGNATHTIAPAATVAQLSALLREKRIGAVVVSRDGRSVDGVASERDIAYKLADHGAGFAQLPVSAIMTPTVVTCHVTDLVATVAATMRARNFRHMPVVDDNGHLTGMVSIRDVLNIRVDELQQEAALLRSFAHEATREPQDRD